jgi:NADPH-dependent 2,4-dienoyl-CoA reductase/sulfur reductase-like enzyme
MNQKVSSTQASEAETTVAIIGYGTAGVNALIALRTAGYQGRILVFSDTNTLPYSPILTSYYAGGEKSYAECFPWSAEELDDLDAEILSESPVLELDPVAHSIRTEQGSFSYTKCLIATGATPQCFTDAGSYEPLVLRTMEDARRLKDALTNPGCRRVLVSGASMVALKTLEACLERGLEATLVGMNPHVLDFNALPEAAVRFEAGLREKGVALLLGQTITAVKFTEDASHTLGYQLEVSFSTGEVQRFDAIAVAHGMRCNLDFVGASSLERENGLIVDNFLRTSDPDVYAAGDVAQALERISGEQRIVGNWKNAAVQGACAGRAIAAELAGTEIPPEASYPGSIATNTIAVQGTLFLSAGTMELTPPRHVEVCESDEMTVVRIYEDRADGTQQLVGFNLVCDDDESGSAAYDTAAMLTLRIRNAL